MKTRQTGSEAVPWERTDRRTGMTNIAATFRRFASPSLLLTAQM